MFDIGSFWPFKHYHIKIIDNIMQLSEGDFSKLKFLAKFQTICNQTFKKSTIRSAFRNTRLISYNPEVVLQKVYALPRFI